MKTWLDRLNEMPLITLQAWITQEQKAIWAQQRDLDTMNRVLQQRTWSIEHAGDKPEEETVK